MLPVQFRVSLKLKLIFTLLISCSLAACFTSKYEAPKPLPDLRVIMLDGDYATLSEIRGTKPMVLFFWASWCNSSRPFIVNLSEEVPNYPGVKFVAVSVNKEADYETLSQFIKEQNLASMEHIFSGNDYYDEAYQTLEVTSIPTAFVIDSSGQMIGESHTVSGITSLLDEL